MKTYISLVVASLLAITAQAELAQPVIKRDANGLVTITCDSPSAIIYYTLDGSEPTDRSGAGVYLAPIVLPYKGVVKAKAYDASSVAASSFDAQGGVATPPSTAIPLAIGPLTTGDSGTPPAAR